MNSASVQAVFFRLNQEAAVTGMQHSDTLTPSPDTTSISSSIATCQPGPSYTSTPIHLSGSSGNHQCGSTSRSSGLPGSSFSQRACGTQVTTLSRCWSGGVASSSSSATTHLIGCNPTPPPVASTYGTPDQAGTCMVSFVCHYHQTCHRGTNKCTTSLLWLP